MNFLRKVTDNKINKVELISVLSDQPLAIVPKEGDFSATDLADALFDKVYFTVSSAELTENGKDTEAGYQYVQEFSFKFPTNEDRKKLLMYFRILRHIRISFCNGKQVYLGRNDYEQNRLISGQFSTDGKFTRIQWAVQSIFPFEFME